MKKLFISIILFVTSLGFSQDWNYNFEEAKKLAAEQNKNIGFGKANNIGISLAMKKGADYVFLLNQDAWVEDKTLEKLINIHRKQPKFGIVSPMHLNGKGDELDYNFSKFIVLKRNSINQHE